MNNPISIHFSVFNYDETNLSKKFYGYSTELYNIISILYILMLIHSIVYNLLMYIKSNI